MSSTAAASGFVFFLLSVQVIQSEDGWGVIYTSLEVCSETESTVEIQCSYTYPSRIQHRDIKSTFWFINVKDGEPVDLRTDTGHSGRIQYRCSEKFCNLMITHLRESDSAVYKFRFTTDDPKDKYTGFPGVTLTVTDPGVHVLPTRSHYTRVDLRCLSSCVLGDRPVHLWYKNGRHIKTGSSSYTVSFGSTDAYACAVRGFEKQRSPPVYAPRRTFVIVRPKAVLEEGSSMTMFCRSDASPAAEYTWHQKRRNANVRRVEETLHLVFSDVQYHDSGVYYCKAENEMGRMRSESVTIFVKHAPQIPVVSAKPSAEVPLGSSVTLTCDSDAYPAASYTWYKENEDSPKAKGETFAIADFSAEHVGNYSCEARNDKGRNSSTFQLTEGNPTTTTIIQVYYIWWNLVVVLPIALLCLCLRMRKKKKAPSSTTKPDETIDGVEAFHSRTLVPEHQLHRFSAYDDAAYRENTREQEDSV